MAESNVFCASVACNANVQPITHSISTLSEQAKWLIRNFYFGESILPAFPGLELVNQL